MFLLVRAGYTSGRAYKLHSGNMIVGRNPNCQLVLSDDLAVSRQHLRLTCYSNQRCAVTDLASTNGTLLDGRRMLPGVPVMLEIGSTLSIGQTVFELITEYQPGQNPPSPPMADFGSELETMHRRASETQRVYTSLPPKMITNLLPPLPEVEG